AWYKRYGIKDENLRLREHEQDELSHYSKRTVDIEYAFPFTDWGELEGIANRTDYDLAQHQKFSGEDLTYFDQEKNVRYLPYVIEPAAGADRATLAFLIDAYTEETARSAKGEEEKRVVLKLHHALAPYKAAVLPLSRNERLVPTAKEVAASLRSRWMIDYDDAGSIGRRYRRQDEIGTPYCVTVDFDTLEDQAVTVRDRDTMTQERIGLDALPGWLAQRLPGC
ncbi:MAG TPA: glycine--tRNA ligase, partial [Candidatus Nanopelagicales bacterium]|nr:glycine--tRNA ligase [Candidatus Nanopelagicales bacterium]